MGPQLHGFPRPAELEDPDAQTLLSTLEWQLKRGSFKILTKSTADVNVRGISQAMVLRG